MGEVIGMVKLMNLRGRTRRAYTCSEQMESLYESKPIP